MLNYPLPRIDKDEKLRKLLLPYCRFKEGTIWIDEKEKHKIACVDVSKGEEVKKIFGKSKVKLSVQDPPYNFIAFTEKQNDEFIKWCEKWISLNHEISDKNSVLAALEELLKRTSFRDRPLALSLLEITGKSLGLV